MAAATITPDYVGRKIIVKTDEETFEGKVKAARPIGVLIQLKGKSQAELIDADEITSWELVEESTDLTQSKLKPVKLSNVRRHLVNFHGWTLPQVNKLDDQGALVAHDEIHNGADAEVLGHVHVDEADKKAAGSDEADED